MNGSTNVQMSGIAIFVSMVTLWLADFFFPDLMATAPEMLGEAFVGFLVIVFGVIFKADAGIKVLPGTGTVNSPAIVGVLALILAVLTLSGCAGTRSAYKAADGLTETAYVVGEHYYAEVRAMNALRDQGQLSESQLVGLRNIVEDTRPTVVTMLNASAAFDDVASADTEDALTIALTDAAIALSGLIDAIKEIVASGFSGFLEWPVFNQAGAPT
ncbi:hypothetical protein LCGC14_2142460 [marine sediment metagenome]|uniref:Uncharacterized protein n=1 Tax=marine sediment metagenome TaxID=412755 RepID=A0A0F9GU79_9ZZZZ